MGPTAGDKEKKKASQDTSQTDVPESTALPIEGLVGVPILPKVPISIPPELISNLPSGGSAIEATEIQAIKSVGGFGIKAAGLTIAAVLYSNAAGAGSTLREQRIGPWRQCDRRRFSCTGQPASYQFCT